MSLDKNQAIERLNAIEKEQKELRRIIENADKPKTIFERVFDIPSAIIELGEAHPEVKEYRLLQTAGASVKTLQGQQISIFCAAMNEGVKMSWKNTNQDKHYIWFDFRHTPDHSDFVCCVRCYCFCSLSVSSRHTYSSNEKALHGAKCIKQICYEYYSD